MSGKKGSAHKFAACSTKSCNNYDRGKCIALASEVKNRACPFYCSVKDTKPDDVKYHRE